MRRNLSRRQALGNVAASVVAASAGVIAAQVPSTPSAPNERRAPTLVPRAELVNSLEFEAQARRLLPTAEYAHLAGGARDHFDRITLHPRLMVPALELDLGATLFGDTHLAPIIVAPVGRQRRFHREGELATVRGASAAGAAVIVSSRSDVPLADLRQAARTPLWFQVFAADPAAPSQARQAIEAGCRAICVTIGATPSQDGARVIASPARRDWAGVDAVRRVVGAVPIVVKGIANVDATVEALRHDVQGLVVSNDGGLSGGDTQSLILGLPPIIEAVAGRVPVLTDGGYRRGTDIIKALAMGARAVLVGRPVMWGLAAYGQDGVQTVIEMLQTELARYMAMSGRPTLSSLDTTLIRVHQALGRPEATGRG